MTNLDDEFPEPHMDGPIADKLIANQKSLISILEEKIEILQKIISKQDELIKELSKL